MGEGGGRELAEGKRRFGARGSRHSRTNSEFTNRGNVTAVTVRGYAGRQGTRARVRLGDERGREAVGTRNCGNLHFPHVRSCNNKGGGMRRRQPRKGHGHFIRRAASSLSSSLSSSAASSLSRTLSALRILNNPTKCCNFVVRIESASGVP